MNNQGQANRGQEGTGGGRCKVKGGGVEFEKGGKWEK